MEVVPLLADTLRLLAVLSIIDWPTRSILLRATCTMGIHEEQSMWRHSSNGQVMWISIPIDINPCKVFLFCAFWYLLFWLHLHMAEDDWAASSFACPPLNRSPHCVHVLLVVLVPLFGSLVVRTRKLNIEFLATSQQQFLHPPYF